MLPRLIPTVLIENLDAFHIKKFSQKTYLGDPISIARLFGDMGADEIFLLDRSKARKKLIYAKNLLSAITQEVFTPVAYGGGINDIEDASIAMSQGIEKIVVKLDGKNYEKLIESVAGKFGRQSVVFCINYRDIRGNFELQVEKGTYHSLEKLICSADNLGAGEILFQNMGKSGTREGIDIDLGKQLALISPMPTVMAGGLSSISEAIQMFTNGVDAIAASTTFCLSNLGNAPLISYVSTSERSEIWNNRVR
jgi:cyclase